MTAFDDEQYENAYPLGIEQHFWVAARNGIIYDKLNAAGMAGDRLLDIGCGRGIVVDYLRRRGIDCHGSELAKPKIDESLDEYISTGVDAVNLPGSFRESISGILLLDVIEHIEDAAAFLRRLADAFPNTGRFFITVPAHGELWSDWDEHFGHYRRYSPATLREAVLSAGLQPLKTGGFFHSLYIPMRLMSFLGMKRATRHAAMGNQTLHGVMASFFRLEAKLLPDWVPGTSLGLIAKPVATPSSEQVDSAAGHAPDAAPAAERS